MKTPILVLAFLLVSSIHHLEVEGWLFGSSNPDSMYCAFVDETFTNNFPFGSMPIPECFCTNFKLYTKSMIENDISVSSIPSTYDSSKKTIFIIHGFRDDYDQKFIDLIEALLEQDDFNVITVDWSQGSRRSILTGYRTAAANSRVAAKALYDLFAKLQELGLDQRNTHCIGHSLGAHVCGLAGQYEPFGRISGVDPAGPEFEEMSEGARLSKGDAEFVDVLHTDGGGSYSFDFGTLIPMGDIDFYANGGKKQPGCDLNRKREFDEEIAGQDGSDRARLNKIRSLLKSKRGGVLDLGCSHGRALYLYIESINNPCFANVYYDEATTTSLIECTAECPEFYPVVGYHSIEVADDFRGLYGFSTEDRSPYCHIREEEGPDKERNRAR